jgi:signal transduction histidine kinase
LASLSHEDADVHLLDLVSVLNASRALSSEIRRDALLNRLMGLLLECAGAQTGYLLIRKGTSWVVECTRSVSQSPDAPPDALSAAAAPALRPLSIAITNYVGRTGETVLLHDASADERFRRARDPAESRVESVLCFPLRREGSVVAIAYLENNLVRGAFNEHSLRVLELLSAQALISLENATLYETMEEKVSSRTQQLSRMNSELADTLAQLREMQQQLVTQEKLAALGALTAGIAHEIRNPLNFITNFADVCSGLANEVREKLAPTVSHLEAELRDDIDGLLSDLTRSANKITEHGARASAIVSGMANHARGGSARKEEVDLNMVVAQSLSLAFHGTLPRTHTEVQLLTDYDPTLPPLELIVQDVSRVIVNLVANACYSMAQQRIREGDNYVGRLNVSTQNLGSHVEIRIRDNGVGIPKEALDKIFIPFFTTKPPGEGAGLGLSLSHDIVVRGHAGQLRVTSIAGKFAEFVIELPRPVDRSARPQQLGTERTDPPGF